MSNSVYVKKMENLRKGINVRLVNNGKDFLKYKKFKDTLFNKKVVGHKMKRIENKKKKDWNI